MNGAQISAAQRNAEQKSRFEITRLPGVKAALRSRWPQLLLRTITLAGFGLAILAGLIGTPVGSRNFGIVFVWIAWWALLMLAAVPLFGRGWCSICPIPMPGEWLQQGALLGPEGSKGGGRLGKRGNGRRWPKALRNIWIQNGAFALLALFSSVVLTQPVVSALVLAAFLLIAVGTSLIYERRTFCRYLCPVGGFIGLYSQLAPIELRVKDTAVCAAHTEKTCYLGNADPQANDGFTGYGCPWGVFPGGLTKNTSCGACMECLRTCPQDNITINLRSFGQDLHQQSGRKMDEAFKAFLMLGSALVYSAVMLGPWGALKAAAYQVGSLPWLVYALTFLGFVFGLLPGLFLLAVAAGRKLSAAKAGAQSTRGAQSPSGANAAGKFSLIPQTYKKSFVAFAYSLVPLGLAAWIAFSLSFVFANLSYLGPALSDPFGWGWNLVGTAGVAWTPFLTGLTPVLQAAVLLVGLAWASRTALRTALESLPARAARLQALPVVVFCLAVTVGLLGLLVG